MSQVKVVESMVFNPKNDFVVVKVDKEEAEKTAGGIIIPAGALPNKKTQTGVVFRRGPGRPNAATGDLIPMSTEVGERVLFACFIGYPIIVKGEEYVIIKDYDCMSGVEEQASYVDADKVKDLPLDSESQVL